MPLYEYLCEACGHRFELIRKFSDPPLEECPSCGEKKVHKLVSSPAIQFKGSGWYITDYAKKGGEPKGGDKGGEKKSDEAKSEAKSAETKPSETKTSETKTESKPATTTTSTKE